MWGVPTMDRFARVHAFTAGTSMGQAARAGDVDALKTLDMMGFDTSKKFSPEMVGRFISDRTQFRTGPAHKPLWASSSEWGKFAWQYKTFAYHHGILVKDIFKMAIKKDGHFVTFGQHIQEKQSEHPHASGQLSWLLSAITLATKMIASYVRRAGLIDVWGDEGSTNVQGGELLPQAAGLRATEAASLRAGRAPPVQCDSPTLTHLSRSAPWNP